jgi:hypothetical protein
MQPLLDRAIFVSDKWCTNEATVVHLTGLKLTPGGSTTSASPRLWPSTAGLSPSKARELQVAEQQGGQATDEESPREADRLPAGVNGCGGLQRHFVPRTVIAVDGLAGQALAA